MKITLNDKVIKDKLSKDINDNNFNTVNNNNIKLINLLAKFYPSVVGMLRLPDEDLFSQIKRHDCKCDIIA